jgi:Ca2+-binding EF-hand superfamily protein
VRLEDVWKDVDKDGSGELDAGELKVVLLRMGRQDDIAHVMKQVDSDNSGGVDFEEFCAWFNEMDQAELKVLEDAMQNAKEETAVVTGMGSLRFISKLKKGQRVKKKEAFLARQRATNRLGGGSEREASVFKSVKTARQIEIAREQLTDAGTVDDFHMLSAALRRARRVAYEHDEHTLHAFCDSFEKELDPVARLKINLHNSEVIKREIVRFWDLMAFVSETMAPVEKNMYWHRARANLLHLQNKVTREGYTALHIRIGKSVHDVVGHGRWQRKTAMESAQTDWFDDVARFSGDAGISAWYAKVRRAFQKEARSAVTSMGWTALFKTFDTDGSGSLEVHEFVDAVRSTGIDDDTMSAVEIRQLFRHVDADRSGEVDGAEFADC